MLGTFNLFISLIPLLLAEHQVFNPISFISISRISIILFAFPAKPVFISFFISSIHTFLVLSHHRFHFIFISLYFSESIRKSFHFIFSNLIESNYHYVLEVNWFTSSNIFPTAPRNVSVGPYVFGK